MENGSDTSTKQEDEKKEPETIQDPPFWIYGIAFLGMLMVVGSIVFMIYHALTDESTPPDVIVDIDSIHSGRGSYLVTFHLTNLGDITAQELTVEGNLMEGEKSAETSTTTIQYLPGHSKREGGLFFSKDPHAYRLQVLAKGYEKP
jgi:uncharacterized protein (TIGR02588 family)